MTNFSVLLFRSLESNRIFADVQFCGDVGSEYESSISMTSNQKNEIIIINNFGRFPTSISEIIESEKKLQQKLNRVDLRFLYVKKYIQTSYYYTSFYKNGDYFLSSAKAVYMDIYTENGDAQIIARVSDEAFQAIGGVVNWIDYNEINVK